MPMATRDQLSLKRSLWTIATAFLYEVRVRCIRLTSGVCCDTGVQAPKERRSSLGLP